MSVTVRRKCTCFNTCASRSLASKQFQRFGSVTPRHMQQFDRLRIIDFRSRVSWIPKEVETSLRCQQTCLEIGANLSVLFLCQLTPSYGYSKSNVVAHLNHMKGQKLSNDTRPCRLSTPSWPVCCHRTMHNQSRAHHAPRTVGQNSYSALQQ